MNLQSPFTWTKQVVSNIAGNRAIYHDRWFAGTVHKAPWEVVPRHALAEDVWELYHVDDDFSMARNLAAENPVKLEKMQQMFTQEAIQHHVLPIDDRTIERFDPKVAGRPDLMNGRMELTVYPVIVFMTENAFINVKNTSFDLEAEVEVKEDGDHGVLLAQGGRFGGWALWMNQGKPVFSYNFLGLELAWLTDVYRRLPEIRGNEAFRQSRSWFPSSAEQFMVNPGQLVLFDLDDVGCGE